MSPQARTGIIAAAIVGGLFLCGGGIVAAIVLTKGRDKATDPGKTVGLGDDEAVAKAKNRQISDGNASKDEDYIRNHRWWKNPITRAKYEDLVQKIIDFNHGDHGFSIIDRDCNYGEWKDAGKPANVGEPSDVIEYGSVKKRPNREQAIQILRGSLDRGELRHGPGR